MASDLYADDEYCKREIVQARRLFGDTNTTETQYDAMEKALTMIFLHAASFEISQMAHMTLNEAQMRRPAFEQRWDAEVTE